MLRRNFFCFVAGFASQLAFGSCRSKATPEPELSPAEQMAKQILKEKNPRLGESLPRRGEDAIFQIAPEQAEIFGYNGELKNCVLVWTGDRVCPIGFFNDPTSDHITRFFHFLVGKNGDLKYLGETRLDMSQFNPQTRQLAVEVIGEGVIWINWRIDFAVNRKAVPNGFAEMKINRTGTLVFQFGNNFEIPQSPLRVLQTFSGPNVVI